PYIISEYHRVTDLTSLKSALAEGYPVVIGIDVYASFESTQVAQTGLVPIPNSGEQLLGGHAVLAVGYKDDMENHDQGVVICRNSWSESWGDKGYVLSSL
ncbi:MAG TPA: C1 family peptidase, partial [Desulfosporosinus sp.]